MKKIVSLLCVFCMLLGAVTVSAERETVTVTFEENNGTTPYTIEAERGIPLHELPVPDTDDTHYFCGWYIDSTLSERFDITKAITQPITLYAKWHDDMNFSDVSEDDEFYDSINFVFYNDIMNGISDTEFAPNSFLTRGMVVTILHRMEGCPIVNYAMTFVDVDLDAYYAEAVRWAQSEKIVKGISDTEFAPDKNISREELAVIMHRYATGKGVDLEKASENTNTLSFNDIMNISDYARNSVHCCLATGILIPRGENIEPTQNATRAEAAAAIRGFYEVRTYDIEPEEADYKSLNGEYMDNYSQRATLSAKANADESVSLEVRWSSSASEYTKWSMTAKYNDIGFLEYSDCMKENVISDESGKETVSVEYKNGQGYFECLYGVLMWNGAEEDNCRDCAFEKISSAGIINPMMPADAQMIEDNFGAKFLVPKDASDVNYYIINGEIAQMNFKKYGAEFCARMKFSFFYEDISGMNYTWNIVADGVICGKNAASKRYIGTDKTVDICLLHDTSQLLMLSLSAEGKDLDGFDIMAVMTEVFDLSKQGGYITERL